MTHLNRFNRLVFATVALLFASSSAWARLPGPYRHEAAIASINREAREIVLAEPTNTKFRLGEIIKPTVFVWTEETQFIKNGSPADITALSTNVQARLHYFYPPKKGRPFLVKVVWQKELNDVKRKTGERDEGGH